MLTDGNGEATLLFLVSLFKGGHFLYGKSFAPKVHISEGLPNRKLPKLLNYIQP